MKAKGLLAFLLLLVADLQTADAQGFRVYKSDGTFTQYSMRADSIVFYDGIGEEQDFGLFTPVNQYVAGTWYITADKSVTFNEDGTTDYIAGGTYRFLPCQSTLVVYDAKGVPVNVFKIHDLVAGTMVVSAFGGEGFAVWSNTKPGLQPGEHEYVEIGGLKWATMNVGATTVAGNYVTCSGDYFAWGEATPRYSSMTRTGVNDVTFTWKNGYESGYSDHNWPTYSSTTLDADHDAATANWGGGWRTPTRDEYRALVKACSGSDSNMQVPVELNNAITSGGIYWLSETQTIMPAYTGIAGLLFVSASDISKRVFFPACGMIDNTKFGYGGTSGTYWSSSGGSSFNACHLFFSSSDVYPQGSSYLYRFLGFTVRPVSD